MRDRICRLTVTAFAFTACGNGPSEPATEGVDLTPAFLVLAVGDTATLLVESRLSAGASPLDVQVSVDRDDLVSLDDLRITARAEGIARAYAQHGSVTDTATIVIGVIRTMSVASGFAFTCSLSSSGVAFCWGNNWNGELGAGTTVRTARLPQPVMAHQPFSRLTVGGMHACGLTDGGSVACWGFGDYGQLGDGQLGQFHRESRPVAVASQVRFETIDAGDFATCGLSTDGNVYCWGLNFGGVAGQALTIPKVAEPRLVQTSARLIAIAVGGSACGISEAGHAYCWGPNEFGQLGVDSLPVSSTPVRVTTDQRFSAIAVGNMHACGLTAAGVVFCWGRNVDGQLGVPDITLTSTPQRVPLDEPLVALEAGLSHTCGLTASGVAYCWGGNWRGELGRGTYATPATLQGTGGMMPAPVESDVRFTAISTSSGHHTCGVTTDARTMCWGWNHSGEAGTGTSDEVVLLPELVAYPERGRYGN